MQGGEHQVSGLGHRDRGGDRLGVTHLADQDHVGILPQRVLQRVGEGLGVGAHFALVDHARLVGVDEFDRILDREDVDPAFAVDLVDQGRQRG